MIACWLAILALLGWSLFTPDTMPKFYFLTGAIVVLTVALARETFKR